MKTIISILILSIFFSECNAKSNNLKKHKVKTTETESSVKKTIPESAKNAVKALKKLEAHCQAGISYNDFHSALGDALFEVNMFIESNDAKELQSLVASIKNVVGHYYYASLLWEHKFVQNENSLFLNNPSAIAFFEAYPQANKSIEENGVISKFSASENFVIIDNAIQYIFLEASKELTISFSLLNK
jgi:hypothetical protein